MLLSLDPWCLVEHQFLDAGGIIPLRAIAGLKTNRSNSIYEWLDLR